MAAHFVVILNAGAGASALAEVRSRIDSVFLASGFEADIRVADEGRSLGELARAAVRDGARAVVAGGGDGTISAVAAEVLGAEQPLGILPLGTLNHFAKDLGIPLDLEQATRTIIGGAWQAVDVGEVNGRIFLNNSSLGIYPHMVLFRERHESMGGTRFMGLVRSTVEGLRQYRHLIVKLNVDGAGLLRKTPFVFVGNNVYKMEGLQMATRESLSEGKLCLCVAHRTGRAGLIRLGLHALRGRLREARDFDMLIAKSIRVETGLKAVRVALDGEVFSMEPPLEYQIRPTALRVIVPAGARSQSFAP